ncbi:MAG TPA: cytochrome c biogenesis protein CcsA [Wenzhouxiangella sp.]|nr:cytochrome c biogenesis protein CcsA [Wenzhouxiangella sp.]
MSLFPFAIAIYLAASASLVLASMKSRHWLIQAGLLLAFLGAILHAVLVWNAIDNPAGKDVNFFNMLSLAAVLTVAVIIPASGASRSSQACAIILPGAALCVFLQWVVPAKPLLLGSLSAAVRLHIISSLLAYSLLSIAAINAIMLAVQDRALRHPRLVHRLAPLPPLAAIENIMFKLIWLGWLLLGLSLATGAVFIDDLLAQHLAHKTILSMLSWLLFGLLLLGRWRFGWRGWAAARWTLLAMLVLALAYFGSKLVLELVLGKSWQLSSAG